MANVENIQDGPDGVDVDEEGFDFIGRVIWAEVGRAIMEELGALIFAVGRPDEFHKVAQCGVTKSQD
jgi:conserved oligomeric Golgi complex subunit 2